MVGPGWLVLVGSMGFVTAVMPLKWRSVLLACSGALELGGSSAIFQAASKLRAAPASVVAADVDVEEPGLRVVADAAMVADDFFADLV